MKLKRLSEVSFIDQPSDGANVIIEDGGKLARTDVPTSNLAPAYDSTATYAKDDFCVNGGKLYQCNADISTAEAFNPAHWTEVKVTEVMGGGGGVTPEIMAQIENAQWKSESSEQLFSETVDISDEQISYNIEYTADGVPTGTLKVIYDGTEYTCACHVIGKNESWCGAPYVSDTGVLDYSEYPFHLYFSRQGDTGVDVEIIFETSGTHTVSASDYTLTTTDTFKQAVNDIAGWKTTGEVALFDESATTTAGSNYNSHTLAYSELINADYLIVTFEGKKYTCPKNIVADGVYAYGGFSEGKPDFSEYPFVISSEPNGNTLFTASAGTYAVSASVLSVSYSSAFTDAVKKNGSVVEVDSTEAWQFAVVNFNGVTLNLRSSNLDSLTTLTIDANGTTIANSTGSTTLTTYDVPLIFTRIGGNMIGFIGDGEQMTLLPIRNGFVVYTMSTTMFYSPVSYTVKQSPQYIANYSDMDIKYYKYV